MKTPKVIDLDGATGEGGGQLVRLAVALSAVTSQPIRIRNIRANRPRGGLKSQHFTAIRWLADVTDADVKGLEVGSRELEFIPRLPPTALAPRSIRVEAASPAASSMLILQALLPFLVFAGTEPSEDRKQAPVEIEILGGTNVMFSPSYEYFDQVFLKALRDRFGIVVEMQMTARGWSMGPQKNKGSYRVTVHPLGPGQILRPREIAGEDTSVSRIDATILAPGEMHEELQSALAGDLEALFPGAEVRFPLTEDSGHPSRVYVLLVAQSSSGLRWGRDVLDAVPNKKKKKATTGELASRTSRRVSRGLYEECRTGEVDEHLQDQLVCFQALAGGLSAVYRGGGWEDAGADEMDALGEAVEKLKLGGEVKRDKGEEPFGQGSNHAKTARWVVSQIMPAVRFYKEGAVCQGAGVSFPESAR